MGYQTTYKINIEIPDKDKVRPGEMARVLLTETSSDPYDKIFYQAWKNKKGHSEKWYNHEDYMIRLSKVCPNISFEVFGIGSDDFDVWVKVFKDGVLAQRFAFDPTISFPC